MKRNVVLVTFYHPHRERFAGEDIFALPFFHLNSLLWLEANVKADPEVCAHYDFHFRAFLHDQPKEWCLRDIWDLQPSVVALTCNLSNVQVTFDFCRRLRLILPEVMIVIGGPESGDPSHILRRHRYIDVLVLGEGELPFTSLLKAWLIGTEHPLDGIPGIAFRADDGIHAQELDASIRDLSSLVSPYSTDFIREMSGVVLYGTSRGCPHSCTFCRWNSAPRRFFPVEQVERELGAILDNPKVRIVLLTDAELNLKTERTRRLIHFVKDRNVHGTRLRAFFDFLRLDEDLLQLSREAGFLDPISIGLQSCTPGVLELSNRRWYGLADIEAALPVLSRFYPDTKYDVMYGLPGDDYESFKQTLRWCLEHGVQYPIFHRLMVVPGTELLKNAERYGLVFDRESPHLVYASESYTYSDLLRIEELATSYQVLMGVLHCEDYGFLRVRSVDLVELMEQAPSSIPNWFSYFNVTFEHCVVGIDAGILEPILDFIRARLQDEQAAREFAQRALARRSAWVQPGGIDTRKAASGATTAEQVSTPAPAPSGALRRLAEELLAPWQMGKPIKGRWRLAQVVLDSTGAGAISYVFEWDGHPLHLKVVPRDDAQPRLSYSKHFNIFYQPQPDDEAIPASNRQEVFRLFVSKIRKNDTASLAWPWPRGDGFDGSSTPQRQ